MAYDPDVAERIRTELGDEKDVREVKMFGGLTFMVSGKMTATANIHGDLMVRCDPTRADELLSRDGANWPEMRGKPMSKGWIVVDSSGWRAKKQFASWIKEALDYNKQEK